MYNIYLYIIYIFTLEVNIWVRSLSHVQLFTTPWTVGCHFLYQGIFLTQGLNLHLLLGRWILYHWATWEASHTHTHTHTYICTHVYVCVCGAGAKSLQLYWTLGDPMDCRPPGSWCIGFSRQVGCCALLQGVFQTQGSNPCLFCVLHGR